MQKYLRLLSYENACKVIDFINTNDMKDYAHITVGGVSMQVSDENWDKVETFIKSLDVQYEVGTEAPYLAEQQIICNLANNNIIQDANRKNTI